MGGCSFDWSATSKGSRGVGSWGHLRTHLGQFWRHISGRFFATCLNLATTQWGQPCATWQLFPRLSQYKKVLFYFCSFLLRQTWLKDLSILYSTIEASFHLKCTDCSLTPIITLQGIHDSTDNLSTIPNWLYLFCIAVCICVLNNSAAGMSALRGSQSEYLSSVHSRPGMLASVNVHPWPLIIIESLGRSMILIVLNSSSSRANKLIIDHPLKQSNHYIATTDSLSWSSPLPMCADGSYHRLHQLRQHQH